MAISDQLKTIILNAFGDEGAISRLSSSYSLITTPPEKLKPEQAVPDFDSDQMAELHRYIIYVIRVLAGLPFTATGKQGSNLLIPSVARNT